LGVDLVGNPDKTLEPRIALFVLVHGMANGTFTGLRLGQYVNVHRTDFLNARRVINHTNMAQHIADLAKAWLLKLNSAALESADLEMAALEAVEPEYIDETMELPEEVRLMLEQAMSS
jgi:hypothetical protein